VSDEGTAYGRKIGRGEKFGVLSEIMVATGTPKRKNKKNTKNGCGKTDFRKFRHDNTSSVTTRQNEKKTGKH